MNSAPIKRVPTLFLQAVIILIGIGVLVGLLWEPLLEGRNVNSTFFEVYFNDPFLAYVYVGSIAFFVALSQALRLLGFIDRNNVFSRDAVRTLRTIKYCALILVAFIVGAEVFIILAHHGKDDIAGGVAMGIFATFLSVIIATAAAVFERLLHSAVEMKAENDLTV